MTGYLTRYWRIVVSEIGVKQSDAIIRLDSKVTFVQLYHVPAFVLTGHLGKTIAKPVQREQVLAQQLLAISSDHFDPLVSQQIRREARDVIREAIPEHKIS